MFLVIYTLALFCLGNLKGLSCIGNIGSQRNKWAFNQFDACIGGDMHHLAFINLLLNCFWSINMPDVVVTVEVERGHGNCQQRHQPTASSNGKVDVISLALEITNQSMNGI